MTEANKRQVGGDHYRKMGALEHWDLVALYDWDYYQGQITKYVMRWRAKGGIQDLEKARHVLDKYIEVEKQRARGKLTLTLLKDALEKLEEGLAEDAIYRVNGDIPGDHVRRTILGDPIAIGGGACGAQSVTLIYPGQTNDESPEAAML